MAFNSTALATRSRSPASESVGDAASEREVRSIDTTDFVLVNANPSRCVNCRKDRQKCARKDPNQLKCDRCIELNYTCTIDDLNAPVDNKRRKLQRLKCEACRSAKVKCEPTDRVWPNKCIRCSERSLPCSEPQVSNKKKIQADGRTAATPRSFEDSDEESDNDAPISSRNRGQVGPRTPAHTPAEDVGRLVRPPRRSMSDVVYFTHPHLQPPRNTYTYQPLNGDEIRLLVVQPGSPGQDIVCVMVTEGLQVSRPYQALSYLWGDDIQNKPIMILSYKSPNKKPPTMRDLKFPKLYTRSNLFEALQQLRHPEDPITLYVNALCINHSDKAEKFAQSQRTQEIFNRASNVVVWLGTEKPTTKSAFEFVTKVLDMNSFDRLVREESNSQYWDALTELMRNPLFGRRWLIQELAVARNADVRCGKYTIQWTDFSDAVALFEANLPEIQKYFKFSQASGGPINDIRALGASTLVSVVNNIIRKTPAGHILNRLDTVETLVSMLAVFEASHPIDTIVAVMGLARDYVQVQAILDSHKAISDNYIDFVNYCVKSSGSIDIICRHWAPITREKTPPNFFERNGGPQSAKLQLPSWIPNVSGSAFGAPEDKDKDKKSGRVHGDSFVGLPSRCPYHASSGFPPLNVSFGVNPQPYPAANAVETSQYDGTMLVQGYPLCQIAELGPRAVKGIIQEECLEMGGWTPASMASRTVPARLWRTLVADRGPNNTPPPPWYHRACLHCLQQSCTNGDIDTAAILSRPQCSHIVADFLRRVQSVIWNRRFFRGAVQGHDADGEEKRLFGLVPGAARGGDWVCVLYGCGVPVVLREHTTLEDQYFEVVGESFVYGMMDGEAREGLSDEEVVQKTVSFKLR